MDKIRILLRFLGGYGLGDVCQHTIVLKHLARYRPDWEVTVRAAKGTESCLFGLCHRVITEEKQETEYDRSVDLSLHEQYMRFADRPNTKVTFVLQQVFGIKEYDTDLGRYECPASEVQLHRARRYLRECGAQTIQGDDNRYKAVLVHYQGGSSTHKKNLTDWQGEEIVAFVKRCGRVPIVLDLNKRSHLVDQKTVFSPHVGSGDMWGNFGNGDAAMLGALIRCCEAFVGIDSGPGKIASATETPALICWTKHHPLQFHDPAPNTVHLIPENWSDMPPLGGDEELIDFFERSYWHRTYGSEYALVSGVVLWLAGILGEARIEVGSTYIDTGLRAAWLDTGAVFVIPPCLRSAAWALCKVQAIAAGREIDFIVAGNVRNDEHVKVANFLQGFEFVRKVRIENLEVYRGPDHPRNTRGHTLYVPEGVRHGKHYLTPGAAFEPGRPMADWLPHVPVNTKVLERLGGLLDG